MTWKQPSALLDPPSGSVNQRLPSGPTVIPRVSPGPLLIAVAYSETTPAVVIRPSWLLPSVNQEGAPSGPAVISVEAC